MNTIVVYVDGSDEKSRWIRRTLMRYWNLSFILLMRSVSTAVNRRFSTLEDLVNIGEDEHQK